MHNNPLVSIIIPCYNHQDYVVEALASIKADKYVNKEIVIIDDGSTDQSVEKIRNWIDLNPDISVDFTSRANRGLCSTLNELVDRSKGEYVVILASDDALINDTIAERVRILEANPDKLVLISDSIGIDSSGNKKYDSILTDFHRIDKKRYVEKYLLDEIIFNFAISGAVVMANRSIYSLIGKYPEDLKAEDLFFYMRSAALNKLMFKDIIVSKYRIHGGNTSGVNPELTKTIIKTYFNSLKYVPGIIRKFKLFKRICGLYLHSLRVK